MTETTALRVNGSSVTVAADGQCPLIYVLRNDLDLKGVRAGCGIGECGACTVLVDGRPIRSCSTPLEAVAGTDITTPEGLGTPDAPAPLQQAFIDEQAAQCGYCINGIIMAVAASDPQTSPADVLAEHLCRCGTHTRILGAIDRARREDTGVGERDAVAASDVATVECDASCDRAAQRPESLARWSDVSDWLRVTPDGMVEARSGKVEIGQGIRTALLQVVASSLGLDPDRVVVRTAETDVSPNERYTAGSRSLEEGGTALSIAAMAFRRVVFSRAAERLKAASDALVLTRDGRVVAPAGDVLTLADLVADGPVTGAITDDDHPHWRGAPYGASLPRTDLVAKVTGAAAYVHDMDLPGMVHARVLLPPGYDAQLVDVDLDAARSMPGVRAIMRRGRAVVSIATREEQAVRASARLAASARWDDPGLPPTSAALEAAGRGDFTAMLRALPADDVVQRRDDGVDDRLRAAASIARATYAKPYELHGAMGPSCAVAVDDGGTLSVWTHSQGVHPLRKELATLLERPLDDIVVRHVDGPGCYGHNNADDAAAFAAIAAGAVPGTPVRLLWSLEDEFVWDPFGPAMASDLEASVDGTGRVAAWRQITRTDVHAARPTGAGDRLVAAWVREDHTARPWPGPHETGTRNVVPYYDFGAVEAVTQFVRGPLRSSALRSLASYLNVFAIESFMDELAESCGADPVEFRLRHLDDDRARRVLMAAAETAGWEPRSGPSGRGRGVAFSRYKGTKAYVAVVVDAAIDTTTAQIETARVVVACDAGAIVNPDGLRNQLEGGVMQGLSRALYEEVRVDRTGILTRDWTSYDVLRFSETPHVETVLLDQPGASPLGAGEAATPVVAPALGNAVDDAVGLRLRELPMTPARTTRRLESLDEREMARVRV